MNPFANRKAYTLPVVLAAIDVVGWPNRISNLPQPQRGQLKAALAVELAYPLATLLGQALAGGTERSDTAKLGENDEQYRIAARLRKRREAASHAFVRLERLARRWPLITAKGSLPGIIHFEFEAGHPYNVATVREAFFQIALDSDRMTAQRWCALYEAFIQLEEDLATQLRQIEQAEKDSVKPPVEEKPDLPKSAVIFGQILNIEGTPLAYEGSPISLLKRRENDWWVSFIGQVAGRIEADLKDKIYQIALRDPNILWAIWQKDRIGVLTNDAVVSKVLHDPKELKQIWRGIDAPKKQLNDVSIRVCMHRLRLEDRAMQNWIRTIGGDNHPYDFYDTEPWQHPELFKVSRGDEFDRDRDSMEDQARKSLAAKVRESRRKEFMAGRLPVRVLRLRKKQAPGRASAGA